MRLKTITPEAALKKQLAPVSTRGFVIKRAVFQSCLELYPMEEWLLLMKKMSGLNRFNRKNNDFIRRFTAGVKFVELDVVKRVNNLINPYLEIFAFNYKNNTFVYRCDERYGNSFFKYESALELVNEVRNELNYDLTYFFENKLDKELIVKRKLEDKEREITLKLEDVNFNISKVKGSIQMIGESEVLTTALTNLEKRKSNLDGELFGVKELQYKEVTKL